MTGGDKKIVLKMKGLACTHMCVNTHTQHFKITKRKPFLNKTEEVTGWLKLL